MAAVVMVEAAIWAAAVTLAGFMAADEASMVVTATFTAEDLGAATVALSPSSLAACVPTSIDD
jgi:hypothetical protein